jgi:hypothetical protein
MKRAMCVNGERMGPLDLILINGLRKDFKK